MQKEACEQSIFSVKSFEGILKHLKQFTPQNNTRAKNNTVRAIFLIRLRNAPILKITYHKPTTAMASYMKE